jgi:hypothetical protein
MYIIHVLGIFDKSDVPGVVKNIISLCLKNQLLSQTFTGLIMFLFHFEFQNAETIEKLNESGELRRIFKQFKVSNSIKILYTVRTSLHS